MSRLQSRVLLCRALMTCALLMWLACLAVADVAGWQGTSGPSEVSLTQPTFRREDPEEGSSRPSTAIWASIQGGFDQRSDLKTPVEIERSLKATATEWQVTLQPINLGDYQGYLVEQPVVYERGGWGDSGFRDDGANTSGKAIVTNGE